MIQEATLKVSSMWLSRLITNLVVLEWVNGHTMTIIDATTRGTLVRKTTVQVHTLSKEMTSNNY